MLRGCMTCPAYNLMSAVEPEIKLSTNQEQSFVWSLIIVCVVSLYFKDSYFKHPLCQKHDASALPFLCST